MLNELFKPCFICPVCERIVYKPLRGYWCPYCGIDLNHQELIETQIANDRLTARTETGMPYYIGKFSYRQRSFPQDLSLSAISEILEKLCQYEELEEESNNGENNG